MVTLSLRRAPPGWLYALLLLAIPCWAEITVRTDTPVIHETDSLEIQVQASGLNQQAPDLTPLEADFEILSSRSNSQYRSVNGQVDAWTRWTLTAKPRHSGTLTIPPLELDGQRSRPLTITVKPLDQRTRQAIDALVFFETELTPQPVFVQAQLVMTRRLLYADGAQLYGDMPDVPEVPHAVVQPIGDPTPARTERNGRRYGVIEQRYAIFPERSGVLEIPTVTATGSVRLPAEFGTRRRTGVRVQSRPIRVHVQPVPAQYPPDAPWLPATDVELVEAWDAGREFDLGTPVERTVMVRAEGAVASMIPPLKIDLPAEIRAYPDPPQLRVNRAKEGLVGIRSETMSLVAGKPGAFLLPALSVTWWDTRAGEVRHARLAARQVEVTGTITTSDAAAESGSPGPNERPAAGSFVRPPSTRPADTADWPWAVLSGALTLMLLVTTAGWAVTFWRFRHPPTVSEPSPEQTTERRAYRQLASACAAKPDLKTLREALLRWLAAHYQQPPARSLEQLARDSTDITAILGNINASLYAEQSTADVDLGRLQEAVARLRKGSPEDPAPPLAELYPARQG